MKNLRFTATLSMLILLFFGIIFVLFGQLKEIERPDNYMSEAKIFLDNDGVRYSTLITLKFKGKMIDLPTGRSKAQIDQIENLGLRSFINNLANRYSKFELKKAIPNTFWGDTLRINKRTGKQVKILDMSQIFRIYFKVPVPIDSVVKEMENQPQIMWAEGPMEAYLTMEPNDPLYWNGTKWEFDAIQAPPAWDISNGSSSILISINDRFGTTGVSEIHEDLIDKVVYHQGIFGDHGTMVAGTAAAMTNNNLGIASLGWNIKVGFNTWGTGNGQVDSAVAAGADIINFSWVSPSGSSHLSTQIYNALKQGVICVASAGNDSTTVDPIPSIVYPAAYNWGPELQVIAVSATIRNPDYEEEFPENWNYSPGTDSINDPTNAFIDVAAPGGPVTTLSDRSSTDYLMYSWGTSISAPMVSD